MNYNLRKEEIGFSKEELEEIAFSFSNLQISTALMKDFLSDHVLQAAPARI